AVRVLLRAGIGALTQNGTPGPRDGMPARRRWCTRRSDTARRKADADQRRLSAAHFIKPLWDGRLQNRSARGIATTRTRSPEEVSSKEPLQETVGLVPLEPHRP